MAQLRQHHDQFKARDTVVVVIGPEDAPSFARYWGENRLPFVGLPDPKHSVLRLYGQEVKLFKWGRMPAQILVDKTGVARFAHYGHDMADIPAPQEILGLIDTLAGREAGDDVGRVD